MPAWKNPGRCSGNHSRRAKYSPSVRRTSLNCGQCHLSPLTHSPLCVRSFCSFWDALFTILNSRDRDWVSMLLNLLLTAVINYTVGSVMAVITFILSLPSFLYSYGAGFFSGTLFFVVASIAGLSLIASYLTLIYASGAAVVRQHLTRTASQHSIRYHQKHITPQYLTRFKTRFRNAGILCCHPDRLATATSDLRATAATPRPATASPLTKLV